MAVVEAEADADADTETEVDVGVPLEAVDVGGFIVAGAGVVSGCVDVGVAVAVVLSLVVVEAIMLGGIVLSCECGWGVAGDVAWRSVGGRPSVVESRVVGGRPSVVCRLGAELGASVPFR